MKYLISGYFGYNNVGDETLLAQVASSIRQLDSQAEIRAFSGDPASTQRNHGIRAYPRSHPLTTIAALRWCDVLVSGGGSLMQDVSSWRPPVYYGGLALLAHALNRPYVVYAQGLGPLRRPLSRAIAAQMLSAADALFLRDPESIRLARELGVRRVITFAADPVLTLSPHPSLTRVHVPVRIAVALHEWPGGEIVADRVANALRPMLARAEIILVVMQDRDTAITGRVAERLGQRVRIVGADRSVADRVAAIQSASLVIGMRLHSLILAAAAGRRFVAITYDPKVEAFARMLRQPIAGSVSAPPGEDTMRAVVEAQLKVHDSEYEQLVDRLKKTCVLPARAAVDLAARGVSKASTYARRRGVKP
jgi:polysaccharide pyruvyl transferase CsaB